MKNVFIMWFGLFWLGCTDNPFGGDDKISSISVSGNVILDNSNTHDGVIVWMGGTTFNTKTDKEGNFVLKLPAMSDPNNGGITDGEHTIYFFMSNYRLKVIEVDLVGGKVVATELINDDGELLKSIYLSRLFEIVTTVRQIDESDEDSDVRIQKLLIEIDLKPDVNNVIIQSKNITLRDTIIHTGLMVINEETNNIAEMIDLDDAEIVKGGIIPPKAQWRIKHPINNLILLKGKYLISPFITVVHQNLPNDIYDIIGSNIESFNSSYQFYPMKRTGGEFIIE